MSEKVEVGTRRMREIFRDGVEDYEPTLGGHELLAEGGVTEHSLANLREINSQLGGAPAIIELKGKSSIDQLVYFRWPTGVALDNYVATGFGWGYPGTGMSRFAEFLVQIGFDGCQEIRAELERLPQDWCGCIDQDDHGICFHPGDAPYDPYDKQLDAMKGVK